jgi:hypothetical protein
MFFAVLVVVQEVHSTTSRRVSESVSIFACTSISTTITSDTAHESVESINTSSISTLQGLPHHHPPPPQFTVQVYAAWIFSVNVARFPSFAGISSKSVKLQLHTTISLEFTKSTTQVFIFTIS